MFQCFTKRKETKVKAKVVMKGKLFQRCTHSFVLQCILSLFGNVNTRRMSKPDIWDPSFTSKSMKYSGHRKLLCELSKLSSILVYKFSPERTGFHMYAQYTQLQFNFLALQPWVKLTSDVHNKPPHVLVNRVVACVHHDMFT